MASAPDIRTVRESIETLRVKDNEFLSRDSLAFRQYLSLVTPDIDMNTKITDSNGKKIEVAVPITVRFFWPSTGV